MGSGHAPPSHRDRAPRDRDQVVIEDELCAYSHCVNLLICEYLSHITIFSSADNGFEILNIEHKMVSSCFETPFSQFS